MMVCFTIRWGLKGALWSYESYKIPTEWIHGTGKISGNLKSIGTSIIKRDTEPKMNIFSLEIQVLWCFSCPETSRNHLSSPGWFNRRQLVINKNWDASILIESSLIIIFLYIFSGYLRFTMMVLSEFVRVWKYFFLVGPESPCTEDVLRVAPRPCAVRRTCQFAGTPGEDQNRDGSALDLCSK